MAIGVGSRESVDFGKGYVLDHRESLRGAMPEITFRLFAMEPMKQLPSRIAQICNLPVNGSGIHQHDARCRRRSLAIVARSLPTLAYDPTQATHTVIESSRGCSKGNDRPFIEIRKGLQYSQEIFLMCKFVTMASRKLPGRSGRCNHIAEPPPVAVLAVA